MRDLGGAPVPITVTSTGKDWLGDELARRLQGSLVDVSRPSTRSARTSCSWIPRTGRS